MNMSLAVSGQDRTRSRVGFTLMELMIGIAIIGVLLAIGVPSYKKARLDSQRKVAESEVQMLATAVRQLMWDTHFYPNAYEIGTSQGNNLEVEDLTGAGAGVLRASAAYTGWKGPYMRKLGKDPWGKHYWFDPDYIVSGQNRVVVGSYGPNRVGLNNYDKDNIVVVLK